MKFTHPLIKSTAVEMAGAFYEEAARNPVFYKAWPKQMAFIRKCWMRFIPPARDALVTLLTMNVPDTMKDRIHDALVKERGFDEENMNRHQRRALMH